MAKSLQHGIDKAILLNVELDKVISAAQKLLLQKFLSLRSLQPRDIDFWVDNYLQVVHSRSNHWITVN